IQAFCYGRIAALACLARGSLRWRWGRRSHFDACSNAGALAKPITVTESDAFTYSDSVAITQSHAFTDPDACAVAHTGHDEFQDCRECDFPNRRLDRGEGRSRQPQSPVG